MLITRSDGQLTLVTQPDHAALAGVLAEQWGTERFEVPGPREALICAAHHHDDGWYELDGLPAFNGAAQRTAHFTELPLTTTAGPYGRGVESVYARDPHAGALASMHWSGFSTSRWGVGGDRASDDPLSLEIVAAEETRWMPALRQAWGNRGRRSQFDAATWHAYEVLQAVDLLSLTLALMDLEAIEGERQPVPTERTLGSIDQEPGPRSVGAVPEAAGAGTATIMVRAVGEGRVELGPYPLQDPQLTVELPIRRLEDRHYAAEEAAEAYHAAPVQQRRITLVPAR